MTMNLRHLVSLLAITAAALGLSACGDSEKITRIKVQYMTTDAAPLYQSDTKAQADLANASVAIDQSSQEDAAIQLASNPKSKIAPPLNASALGMTQVTSIDWYGPLEPLLTKLGQACGYRLRVLGHKPPTEIIVSLSEQHQQLAEILQNAIYQAANKARVAVYPKSRVIELRYPN